jgi:hypothetical protein
MSSKGDRFTGHTFLKATVASKSDDVIVDDCVVSRIVFGGCHFARKRITSCIANALTEWASGGFHARSFMELWVTWGDAVENTELRDIVNAHGIAAEVQPRIDEHGAVTCTEDETITVQPFRIGWITLEAFTKKNGTDLSRAERKAEMT